MHVTHTRNKKEAQYTIYMRRDHITLNSHLILHVVSGAHRCLHKVLAGAGSSSNRPQLSFCSISVHFSVRVINHRPTLEGWLLPRVINAGNAQIEQKDWHRYVNLGEASFDIN